MINAVNREIPDEILEKYHKEGFQGSRYRDGKYYRKASPRVRGYVDPERSKMAESVKDAIRKCGGRDGMVFGFHHHFRDGDYIVNMVVRAAVEMGLRDITIAASSLGSAHDPVADYIEQGIVTGIQCSGIRGRIGEAVSHGKLKTPAIVRSHGGRVRAIEEGDVHIDIAFIGAPTCDEYGNARALGGKSDCGVLSYSKVDAQYADHVVVITDCLVPYPNVPASISQVDVDYVVVVDEIGDPKKIASNVVRMTEDRRELLMAEYCTRLISESPYFKDGFSFQTGAGGASLAVNTMLRPILEEKGIKLGFAIGGITRPMCELLDAGLVRKIVDAQAFDTFAIESLRTNPNHIEISTSEYANPMNKGAFVNRLDFVILGALEVDIDYNVNVTTGSDGVLRGAPGGHPDTAAGSKCCIIVTPLIRGRMATVCEHVVTVTTPGDCVDVLVTDYGIAVNPLRPDLVECLDKAGIKHVPIEELKEKAYSLVGRPDDLQWEDEVVAVLEARDGTILDVIRKIKPYTVD